MSTAAPADDPRARGVPPGRGPYAVGCGDVMTRHPEPELFMRLYYPIDQSKEGIPLKDRPSWLPSDDYAQGYAQTGGFKRAGKLVKRLVGDVTVPARWHGSLTMSRTTFPVVVFSHGLGACRTAYSAICIDIASCGCVVAAVEHRDNSACYSFYSSTDSDDTVSNSATANTSSHNERPSTPQPRHVNFIKAPYEERPLRQRQITQRINECVAALDYLEILHGGRALKNDFDAEFDLSQFKNRLDLSDAAVCGQSYGAATAIATLSTEPRFKCTVACDPWGYPLTLDPSFRQAKQPLLIINTEKFQFKDNMVHLLCLMPDPTATTGPRQMITIRGTKHLCQTDMGLVFPPLIGKFLNMRDKLHPRIAMATNNDALIKFLAEYINLERGPDMVRFEASSNPLIILGHNVDMGPSFWERLTSKRKKQSQVSDVQGDSNTTSSAI